MNLDAVYSELKPKLDAIGQGHLLRFYDALSDEHKKSLLEEISALEFDHIPRWVDQYVRKDAPAEIPEHFEPAEAYDPAAKDAGIREKLDRARKLGEDLIRQGKVAAFVVAGGQGTRLGFDGPKGSFQISPIKNKPLFQIFAETILAAGRKFGHVIPWYIMTSELNYQPTVEFFRKNKFFGLESANVIFFKQGTLPNFDFDGRILMAEKWQIAKSPDGHGGSLKALHVSGALENMKKRGVGYISYFQVDNPLINIVDPLFIGLHAMDKAQMSAKALAKCDPFEKVGNFCIVDGKVTVIEYSDLPDEHATRRNPDGSLTFELGSIAIHIISRSFVERLNAKDFGLPIHRAVKKIPHIDEKGRYIEPEKPNGVKLETFVFDALPMAENAMLLRTERSQEFAPVKNASGTDSPEVTRRMMTERAADWLERAGVSIPHRKDHSIDCVIEMAPSFALEPQDVPAKVDTVPEIKPGDTIYLE